MEMTPETIKAVRNGFRALPEAFEKQYGKGQIGLAATLLANAPAKAREHFSNARRALEQGRAKERAAPTHRKGMRARLLGFYDVKLTRRDPKFPGRWFVIRDGAETELSYSEEYLVPKGV